LFTDPAGDAQDYYVPGSPNRADLDVRSVSVANDRSVLRLVTRVAHLDSPQATGENYYVFFSVKDISYTAQAYRGLDATTFRLDSVRDADPSGNLGQTTPIAGSVDQGRGTIALSVPLQLIGHPRTGARVYDVSAVTGETVGTADAGAGATIDDTSRGHVYVIDRPVCSK
jgi:hypothetical protein